MAAEVDRILALVPQILGISHKKMWINYDQDVDVLYISFKKPGHADDSELTDDDIVIRYENGQVIGMTILNASKRKSDKLNLTASETKKRMAH